MTGWGDFHVHWWAEGPCDARNDRVKVFAGRERSLELRDTRRHGGKPKRAMIASQGRALRAHRRRKLEAFLEVLQLGPYRRRLFQAAAYRARCLKTVSGNHQHR